MYVQCDNHGNRYVAPRLRHAATTSTRPGPDTETTCHCGAAYNGSDHCPACGCEQYESLRCYAQAS